MTQYTYLIGDLLFLLVWIILFMHRKDLRQEMLIMSVLVMPLGVADLFYYKDYWRPEFLIENTLHFGIESFIFTFMIGGITAVIYEEVFGKTYAQRHRLNRPKHLLITALAIVLIVFVGNKIMGINSIYITSAIMIVSSLIIMFIRHDLIKEAIMSGLLVGLLMFVFYTLYFLPLFPGIIQKWWLLDNLSGVFLTGVPVEELLWGFSWGLFAGPIYEFILGLKLKKLP